MQSIRIKMYYYTYAYLREDRTPYYIGKGKGNRIYDKRKTTKPPKDKSRIIFLKQNLTEQEAFKHEIYMIFLYGRKDLGTGILHNRTDGGEGSSGAIISEETRIKMSEAQKGKIFSEEHRRKMSEAQKGKTRSEETRIKMSERIRSEESRKKMSESGKVKIFSEEHRKNISKSHKGKKWWNDGYGNIKYMAECPGDSWRLGRKKYINKCKECVDLLINKVDLQEFEDIMHNLIPFNELAFSYQNEDNLQEISNDGINDYFECLTECDDTTQSCKRICKSLLM